MAKPKFDRDRAARVLTMASTVGSAEAAKEAGITERTLRNWRKRLENDPELSAAFREKNKQVQEHLDADLRAFLSKAVGKLGQLIEKATVDHIHQVAGAVKIVGDLTNTRGGLGLDEKDGGADGGQPSGNGAGPAATEDACVVPLRGVKGIRSSG